MSFSNLSGGGDYSKKETDDMRTALQIINDTKSLFEKIRQEATSLKSLFNIVLKECPEDTIPCFGNERCALLDSTKDFIHEETGIQGSCVSFKQFEQMKDSDKQTIRENYVKINSFLNHRNHKILSELGVEVPKIVGLKTYENAINAYRLYQKLVQEGWAHKRFNIDSTIDNRAAAMKNITGKYWNDPSTVKDGPAVHSCAYQQSRKKCYKFRPDGDKNACAWRGDSMGAATDAELNTEFKKVSCKQINKSDRRFRRATYKDVESQSTRQKLDVDGDVSYKTKDKYTKQQNRRDIPFSATSAYILSNVTKVAAEHEKCVKQCNFMEDGGGATVENILNNTECDGDWNCWTSFMAIKNNNDVMVQFDGFVVKVKDSNKFETTRLYKKLDGRIEGAKWFAQQRSYQNKTGTTDKSIERAAMVMNYLHEIILNQNSDSDDNEGFYWSYDNFSGRIAFQFDYKKWSVVENDDSRTPLKNCMINPVENTTEAAVLITIHEDAINKCIEAANQGKGTCIYTPKQEMFYISNIEFDASDPTKIKSFQIGGLNLKTNLLVQRGSTPEYQTNLLDRTKCSDDEQSAASTIAYQKAVVNLMPPDKFKVNEEVLVRTNSEPRNTVIGRVTSIHPSDNLSGDTIYEVEYVPPPLELDAMNKEEKKAMRGDIKKYRFESSKMKKLFNIGETISWWEISMTAPLGKIRKGKIKRIRIVDSTLDMDNDQTGQDVFYYFEGLPDKRDRRNAYEVNFELVVDEQKKVKKD